jgi:hypothetical protein
MSGAPVFRRSGAASIAAFVDPARKSGAESNAPRKIEETPMKKLYQFKAIAMTFCLCLVVVTALSSAKADDWNNKTTMTFSEPVEVPGVGAQTLPAGTYVFKIADSLSDRHIVQIFNVAEDHVYTTILAIPNYRLKATGKTVVTFRERGEGQPEAIHAWFYPGKNWGEEFVYPKTRAIELAKIVHEPVLATTVDYSAPVETLKTAPIIAVAPTGDEVAVADVVQAPPVETATVETPAPQAAAAAALPATATPFSLVALMGLLSLSAWFGLSAVSKRIV